MLFPSLQSSLKMRTWGKKVFFGCVLENKFKVLNSDKKKWVSGEHPLLKTFVGDLFKKSEWAYDLFYLPEPIESKSVVNSIEKKVEEAEVKSLKFQEAVKSLSEMVEKSPEPIIRENIELTSENWTSFQVPKSLLTNFSSKEVLVLFVGLNEVSAENRSFNEKQLDLVQNMAKAMKLVEDDYKILSLPMSYFDRDDLDKVDALDDIELKNLLLEVCNLRPKMVFSLGANVTNFFLKRREKLSVSHGNVVEIRFIDENKDKYFQTLVMPLFHPELLIINPNMKRTTWIDLQKSLPYIGKN